MNGCSRWPTTASASSRSSSSAFSWRSSACMGTRNIGVGHRARRLPAGHRTPWRAHLGRVLPRTRRDLLFHLTGGPSHCRGSPDVKELHRILYVEDSRTDALIMRECFAQTGVACDIQI